jgi:hypothetical protein
MSLDLAALRSNRAVMVSVVVAAVSLSLLALIAIAKMLGWVTVRAPATPMSMAAPANQVAGTVPDLALAPGETLVAPESAPAQVAPMMPHYTAPTPPPAPVPEVPDEPAAGAARAAPQAPIPSSSTSPAPAHKPAHIAAAPRTPSFARGDPHPSSPLDPWPNPVYCEHCGRVVATTTYPDMAEVRVRFDDGSLRTLRSPAPTPWHVGDRVRLDRGRLVRD